MKKKLLSGAIVVTMALVGCQAADEGAAPNGNMDQPRVGNNTGDGMTNVRNNTLERDADRFQNRDGRYFNNNDLFDSMNNNGNNRVGDRNDGVRNNGDRNNGVRNVGDRQNTHYEVSKEAANKISNKVKEINNVYVLTTDNNAYVAAELDTDRNDRNNNRNNNDNDMFDDQLSDKVKKEISNIVRSVDKDIDNVYVSTNPDFLDLANNYANDIDRGEPVEGFFDQIGHTIERLFPENQRK
ncbi:YhcN/YlaJ family sporulation lipoprotein [Oceanobacillus sp. Castelsardo]|uniref:YhcN/YlaJ family sporulation lipoprotein n=1 Tax=Oceanobacillus sp. Castelsardo TaxID=1851204 RepID=UPI00083966FC|nr:YhcN/YlaJ family sporulation lipoprotein [Oceanobacillus sp. Castelsardo]